ncbi:MAG: AmmeMemoRadiSam system protein B [bacterium]
MNVRKPAVSGQFYPGNPNRLSEEIDRLTESNASKQKALGVISPHAGYMYSGHIAGLVFSSVEVPETVVILGPNHTGCGPQASIMNEGTWQMPMGDVTIDQELAKAILDHSDNIQSDISAQMLEHSIEVQIPFLQHFRPQVKIVPIVLAGYNFSLCNEVADALVQGIQGSGKDTLIVASTDLTHYRPQDEAYLSDQKVIDRVLQLDAKGLLEMVIQEGISMCGVIPVTTMILAVKEMGATRASLIKYMTSGDVSGDLSHVVGYAGMIIL